MRILKWLVMVAIALATMAHMSQAQDDEEAFVALFDGQSLAGWRGYRQADISSSWDVQDGWLHTTGTGPDLMTVETYGDFELRWEWRIAPQGNSGVLYRVVEGRAESYRSGLEYQLLDDRGFTPSPLGIQSAAALYGLFTPREKSLHGANEVNSSRIVVQGRQISHWLNDDKVVTCEIGSPDWQHRLQASKFYHWPEFAQASQGAIVLQAHGSEVWFRKLRIKVLTSPVTPVQSP